MNGKGSLRIHGGLLTISRSRTFLTLSNTNKTSIHSSTPDLTRSVPNTPGSSHKLSLTSSYDSVLEENEDEGVMVLKKGGKDKKKNGKYHNSVQHIFDNVQMRRKSEDFLDKRTSTSSSSNANSLAAVELQQQHVQQNSEQSYRLIPRVKNPVEGTQQTYEIRETANFTASTSKSSVTMSSETSVNYSHWGHVRSSNSFAADLNVSNISTYTIPRVTLTHQRAQSNEPSHSKAGAQPRKSLPDNRVNSTFLRHDIRDSTA